MLNLAPDDKTSAFEQQCVLPDSGMSREALATTDLAETAAPMNGDAGFGGGHRAQLRKRGRHHRNVARARPRGQEFQGAAFDVYTVRWRQALCDTALRA